MALCSICSNIEFNSLPMLDEVLERSSLLVAPIRYDRHGKTDNPGVAHQPNLGCLRFTAREGCQLCLLILTLVDEVLPHLGVSEGSMSSRPRWDLYFHWDCLLQWSPDCTGTREGFYVSTPSEDGKYRWLLGRVGFCVEKDSPFASHFKRQVIEPDPTSPSVLEKMQAHIRSTYENEMGGNEQYRWPSRILDTMPEGLQEICSWGAGSPFFLTTATLGKLKAGIDTSILPQTFQDAVRIIRELGLRYLWIDSLCIIQDSSQDWASEAAKMADVYGGAYLTIAATRASDDCEGFLQKRAHIYVPITVHLNDEVKAQVFACLLPRDHILFPYTEHMLVEQPLSQRGWAFQERYLSRCTIHFAESQILFESSGNFMHSECGMRCGSDGPRSRRPIQVHLALWWSTVNRYSGRRFTKGTDKLPALAGIAHYFFKVLRFPDQQPYSRRQRCVSTADYLAELWRQDFARCLCWMTKDNGRASTPEIRRVPSWSWASIDSEIAYGLPNADDEFIVVHAAGTTLKSEVNPYGEVTDGWCSLSGKLIPIPPIEVVTRSGVVHYSFIFEGHEREIVFDELNTFDSLRSGDQQCSSEIFLMPVLHGVEFRSCTFERSIFALVVQPVAQDRTEKEPPKFRRIGSVKLLFESTGDPHERWLGEKENGALQHIILI